MFNAHKLNKNSHISPQKPRFHGSEAAFAQPDLNWNQIRGIQMLVALKFISIAFDVGDRTLPRCPGVLTTWGYVLCPANVMWGPWCSVADYVRLHQPGQLPSTWHEARLLLQSGRSYLWIMRAVVNALLSMICLVGSACLVNYIPDNGIWW